MTMLQRYGVLLLSLIMLVACSTIGDNPTSVESNLSLNGDAIRGKDLFNLDINEAPACHNCHQVEKVSTAFALGPNLDDLVSRANDRVDGLSAEDYIKNSILNPGDFIVPGYRNSMYRDYATNLSEQDINDLIAYLLSL